MGFLVQIILPYILLYKYWALFVITFLASFAIPVPAGTLLVASAAFASQGYFNIIVLLLVVVFANIVGDSTAYFLARLYGRDVLFRVGFIRKLLTSNNFTLIEKGIKNSPALFVFMSRFEVIATLSVNLICGLGKVTYRKFLLFEVLGTLASVLFYATLGYVFGDNWQAINKLIGNFSIFVFLAIALVVSLFWKSILTKLKKDI